MRLVPLAMLLLMCPIASAQDAPEVDEPRAAPEISERAKDFVRKHLIIDGNVSFAAAESKSPELARGAPDWGRRVKSAVGLDLGSLTIRNIEQMRHFQAAGRNDEMGGTRLVLRRRDLDRVGKDGRYRLLLYSQVHPPLAGRLDALDDWFAAGLRVLQLAYGGGHHAEAAERLGGGSRDPDGLTPLGIRVTKRCFELGMIVDLSHCNTKTTLACAELAKKHGTPVIANHTCCRDVLLDGGQRLADYERNITDAELKAIAATGGVVGIMLYAPYLRRPGTGRLEDLVRHVEHAIRVAGIDHVGVSSDGYLDGSMARGVVADGILDSPERWFHLVEALIERGHEEKDLAKLFGGNFLRVYRQVLR